VAEPKLDTEEASQYLKDTHGIDRKPSTLGVLRVTGGGPAFLKIGRQVRYTPLALDAYAQNITSAPRRTTSEVVAQVM